MVFPLYKITIHRKTPVKLNFKFGVAFILSSVLKKSFFGCFSQQKKFLSVTFDVAIETVTFEW